MAAGVKVIEGPENRILFIGLDQSRDKLLYGDVPGDKNPFKDIRVRRALYQAIDIEAIKTKLMNGQAIPTGAVVPRLRLRMTAITTSPARIGTPHGSPPASPKDWDCATRPCSR